MEKHDENISSAKRLLQLMDILAERGGELTLAQLAKQLDCSVSSVNRLLQTMQSEGYAKKNAVTKKYRLTNKIFTLCNRSLNANRTLGRLIDLAHRLSQKYGISVNINTMWGDEPIMLFRTAAHFSKDLDFQLGDTAPGYCSSSGKAMLSLRTDAELDEYLKRVELLSYQKVRTTVEQVRAEICEARRGGYAVCRGEFVAGVFSLSLPLRDGLEDDYAVTFIGELADEKRLCRPELISDVRSRLDEMRGI